MKNKIQLIKEKELTLRLMDVVNSKEEYEYLERELDAVSSYLLIERRRE